MIAPQESPAVCEPDPIEEAHPDMISPHINVASTALSRKTASLRGVRVACFYPWFAFESTGAWSRFCCLWKFLLEEGAEVTLAFMEKGNNADFQNVSVRYFGEPTVFNTPVALARITASVRSMPELKQYSPTELDFLLRYEKGLYLTNPKVGPWLDEILGHQDIVTCEYPMYAPLLSEYCKKWKMPLVVTCLDMLYELHGVHPRAKERLKEKEIQALGLADALVFCNEKERNVFAQFGLKGVTVLNTGDALSVIPGHEDESRESVRARLNLKATHYCLFIGSAHGPNTAAAAEVRLMAKQLPDVAFVVAGNCCAKMIEGNFVSVGPATDEFLDTLYRGARVVLVPLTRGTGQSVKTFQAFIHGKPVISTPTGARGYTVTHGQELLIVAEPADFPASIRRLLADGELRQSLSENARACALSLDFREHFQPYGDIISRLLKRPKSSQPKSSRSLFLVDNNLSDRIGHHFNYALALKEQCAAESSSFFALVKRSAPADVLAELSATGEFSQGIHEDSSLNPFPADWGNLRSIYDLLLSNDHFAKELEAGLAKKARPGDLVFLPNATPRQMLGLALFLLKHPLHRTLKFVLILRYSIYSVTGPISERKTGVDKETADLYALAIEKLVMADFSGAVRLATDSVELAKEYGTFSQRPIEVLPIPHTIHPLPAAFPPNIPAKAIGKIRIVYMGDARDEKGFELLPAVVRACAAHTSFSAVEFVFQAFISSHYHQKMALVIDELDRLKLPQVHLIKTSLSTDAYQVLLDSADLVLLPYDVATYRARTSGPFVEAICASKPVVVPRNSWMSAQLKESRAGVVFNSGNAEDLVRAVLSTLSNLKVHAAAAGELGKQFRGYHNPQNFIQYLMGPASPAEVCPSGAKS